MTEKDPNDPDIFSGLHEVGGEGMAEGVWKETDLEIPAAATAFLKVRHTEVAVIGRFVSWPGKG
jgi:hypothetical protein